MSDWDEIQKLASDLQRAQLSSSSQKLSERNCIEIVNTLVASGLLEVIHTSDGKEYLTPKQLHREMSEELFVSGGRMSLTEMAQVLNVDFLQVEAQAEQLIKLSGNKTFLVLGQLVTSQYLDRIAEEVNDKLKTDGVISLSSITTEQGLPADFLQEKMLQRLGRQIEGFQDGCDAQMILTTTYVKRIKAKIRGILTAITNPTSISSLVSRFGIEGKLLMKLTDELIKEDGGRISGCISGGRHQATYIPTIFVKAQTQWVDDFFRQNNYLEYDTLTRLGIGEPENYIRRRYKEMAIFLHSCCVSHSICHQITGTIDEVEATFVDVLPLLPSVLGDDDAFLLLQNILTAKRRRLGLIFAKTVFVSHTLVDRIVEAFKANIIEKANRVVSNGEYALAKTLPDESPREHHHHKKTERRKKIKSVKKVPKREEQRDSNEDELSLSSSSSSPPPALTYLTLGEVENSLRQLDALIDAPDLLFADLASHIQPILSQRYKETVLEVYQSSLTASMHQKKKWHLDFQEKTFALWESIRLFEKGLALFEKKERDALEGYLVKSLCTELVNGVVVAAAASEKDVMEIKDANQRLKLLTHLPQDVAGHLLVLHKALTTSSVATFLEAVDEHLSGAAGDMTFRRCKLADKKKHRQTAFHHRQSLMEQLESSTDPAKILHLACLIIFQLQTGTMLHASGKFVPIILTNISTRMDGNDVHVLNTYQTLVIKHLTSKNDDIKEDLQSQLDTLTQSVKCIVKRNMVGGGGTK